MDLTQLKYIVVLAEEGKMARAAEKLFITSSALSQWVKKLENQLGLPLFEKLNSHTFELTSAGEIYVEAARRILKIKEETYRILEDVQHGTRGKFTFGCSPKRGLAIMTNVYPSFYKTYPQIQIDLKEAYLNTLYDQVVRGTVDLAVLTPMTEELDGVNLEFLDREEIVLAVPQDHPLTEIASPYGENSISISDLHLLQTDNWMMSTDESMLRIHTDDIFSQAGFYPEKVLLETSSTVPQIAAIEEGIAVGLVTISRRDRISDMQIFHLEPRQFRTLYAVYRKSYILSESQQYLIQLIREYYSREESDDVLPYHRLGW